MRRKKALISVLGILLTTLALLGWTFRVGNAPLLGLDLEGGLSVVLRPTSSPTPEQLEQAISIMDQRINSLGVAEPDIHREGDNIVVQIAGLKDEDKDKAIRLVGQTAELRFRPVLQNLAPDVPVDPAAPPVSVPGATSTTAPPPSTGGTTAVQAGGAGDPVTPPTAAAGGQTGLGLQLGETAAPAVAQQAPGTEAPATTAATAAPAPADPAAPGGTTPGSAPPTTTPAQQPLPDNGCAGASTTAPTATTAPEVDNQPTAMCQQVILAGDPRTETTPQRYLLGPACVPPSGAPASCATGSALDTARASIDQGGQWIVNPVFKGGADGIDKFNSLAAKCFSRSAECPTGQMAITLDGLVLSAPTMQESSFAADRIQISGSFTQDTAQSLATALQYGSLPVTLEQQSSQTVSATIGRDALTAGIVAGFLGVALVFIYMVAFYRLLGVLAILKLLVESALLWIIISYLGTTAGLALTLAGVTGIIISVGVSLDSNILYYENLRDDVRSGRTIRAAVERSFQTSFSTILKADGASLLGAILLYLLAIGAVRGFAFFLGLTTALDLLGSYFFMRPLVYLALNSKAARKRPGLFGLPPEQVAGEASRSRFVRPSKTRVGTAAGGGSGARGAPATTSRTVDDRADDTSDAAETDADTEADR